MAKVIKTPLLYRTARIERSDIDEQKRTVRLSFSSEAPVQRLFGEEILDHSESSLVWDQLRGGGALLFNHDPDKHIGSIREYGISNRRGYAIVEFSKSALGEEKFRDALDGHLFKTSVGYTIHKLDREKDGERPICRATRWEPLEISMVTVQADTSVGIGRSSNLEFDTIIPNDMNLNHRSFQLSPDPATDTRGGGTIVDRESVVKEIHNAQLQRINDINAAAEAMGKNFPEALEKIRDMARAAVNEGVSKEDFNHKLLTSIAGFRQAKVTDSNIGMSDKEIRQYSFARALRNRAEGKEIDGLELEAHRAFLSKTSERCQGFWVPPDVMVGTRTGNSLQRDLNVTTGSQGGNLVQTTIVTPIIEILRNRMVTARAGVQTMAGLQGQVAIPRQTGAATAYAVAEAGTLTKSTQVIDQLSMSPKRIGAWNNYTKQLLLQSSVDVENFIRDDLMRVLALKMDYNILQGTGANTPTGILHTNGIGSVTFGAAATWAKVISFETAIAAANADVASMTYITTPAVRGKWKSTVKVSNTASFLWENNIPQAYAGPAPDYGVGTGNEGVVNGYRALASNQIDSDYVAFGAFSDCIAAMWGGIDVMVNPYTNDTEATVRVTVNAFVDVGVRHAASFAWSTDSGAQ